jgi:hypothetical protein
MMFHSEDSDFEIDSVVIDLDSNGHVIRRRKLGAGKLIALSPTRQVITMMTKTLTHVSLPDGSCDTWEFDFVEGSIHHIRHEPSLQLSLFRDDFPTW